MPSRLPFLRIGSVLAPLLVSLPAQAEEARRIDIGLRVGTSLASGVPANDMPGLGLRGTYVVNDRWSLGLELYRTDFDYEEPARRVGLPVDPDAEPIDAKAEQTIISAMIERSFSSPEARRQWFLGAKLGIADTNVPVAVGTTATGEPFEVHTEVDRETILSLLGGVRQRFGEHWFGEFTVNADQHFAAWESEDVISGATGRSDDYFAYGFHLGIGYRF